MTPYDHGGRRERRRRARKYRRYRPYRAVSPASYRASSPDRTPSPAGSDTEYERSYEINRSFYESTGSLVRFEDTERVLDRKIELAEKEAKAFELGTRFCELYSQLLDKERNAGPILDVTRLPLLQRVLSHPMTGALFPGYGPMQLHPQHQPAWYIAPQQQVPTFQQPPVVQQPIYNVALQLNGVQQRL